MSKKVYVENHDKNYEAMFSNNDWSIVKNISEADLVCFIGGADVSPLLYHEYKHPQTGCDERTDQRSLNLYLASKELELPCVGICRGGQFLNVISGGTMWQHVEGHGRTHSALDVMTGETFNVSSTHHQMMCPSENAEILVVGLEKKQRREYNQPYDDGYRLDCPDIEALYYGASNNLCYQPHPEFFSKEHPCQVKFFSLIKRHLNL